MPDRRRRMYDCIVQEASVLPAGVTLTDVLEGCEETQVEHVLAAVSAADQPISAAALVSAGALHEMMLFVSCQLSIVAAHCGYKQLQEGLPADPAVNHKERQVGAPVHQLALYNYLSPAALCSGDTACNAARLRGHDGRGCCHTTV